MDPKVRTVDQRIARIANRQHGVVTRADLVAAGVTREEIKQRLRRGTLLRAHRGVFRVGHRAPSTEATYLAAVKACGTGSALSGRAAAHYLRLIKGTPPAPEVTGPTERRVKGVRTRRISLQPSETRVVRGIRVTTPARTLVDLAAVLDERALARACHEAGVGYRTTPRHVNAVLARRPRSPAAAKLRRVMSGDAPVLLSKLEGGFRAMVRRIGGDLPEMNRPAGAHYVDCRWPERRLTIELDSYTFHNSRYSWERDRDRERAARRRGDEFRRYTWEDVFEQVAATEAELRVLLGA